MVERSLGICLGASTIKLVELSKDINKITVENYLIKNHESNPKTVFSQILNSYDLNKFDYITITGRKFKDILSLPIITEPEATEYALKYFYNKETSFDAIASLGAENFIVYVLNEKRHILNVETGNKCASGTGEFFLQQIRRMNVTIDEANELAKNSQIHKVSGRCSVFCKSDCTHALNIGIPIGEVSAGLSQMIANKALDLLEKTPKNNILIVGGVANNNVVVQFLKEKLENLVIPEYYNVFEAYGAACYAMENKIKFDFNKNIYKEKHSVFDFLPPIKSAENLVTFKTMETSSPKENDECVLGLDVGSTTTKAVIIRTVDNSILANVYLRTDGDPINAARKCYKSLKKQIQQPINIIGLGVTGSGRQIAGLHAMTTGVINEIIAHACAAVYFDKDVDTIFEIGGQDAKYTYIINGVPADYAMNEACSAGTGSFLEESAKESLGIDYKDIEKIALKGDKPPNFNDQCAAFISSDIKNASQESIEKENIVAGLVYSICMNYNNRVKGARPIGKKVFMQGGVCYNKAIPMAMACLIDKEIIVPPEPGLMGAFGVALEIKNRIQLGLINHQSFDLDELGNREVSYLGNFNCKGGKENCDRKCEIKIIETNNKKYSFGGACNKYYNLVLGKDYKANDYDLIRQRQDIIFNKYLMEPNNNNTTTVGICRTFLTNSLYPLYYNFFTKLGFKVILSDEVDEIGMKKKSSSFCFPAEIAHGAFQNLINHRPDFIFLPQITEIYVENSNSYKKEHQCTCFILQSEPYFLKSAFKQRLNEYNITLLTPVIDFSKGLHSQNEVFIKIANLMRASSSKAKDAYDFAVNSQQEATKELKLIGKNFIEKLKISNPENIAIILFGRPYNAFAKESNLGIPGKFASRGVHIIPYDMLPFEDTNIEEDITWALGQNIMKAAKYVKSNPQLYGTFITNFSCGPDSFIITYFRDTMGSKPSLTLELDSHTADAGINTRIEAFLDIIDRYKKLKPADTKTNFIPAEVIFDGKNVLFVDNLKQKYNIKNGNVHVLFPSMGSLSSEAVASAFRGIGFKATALQPNDFYSLSIGRKNTSCKECLPLILMTGSLLKYLNQHPDNNENLVYFMPTASGNCRFAQYNVFLNKLIRKNNLKNVALLTLTSENSYAGIGTRNTMNILKSCIIADLMDDIRNSLKVLAINKDESTLVFNDQWNKIVECLELGNFKNLYSVLEDVADNLSKIPLRYPFKDAKVVSILGEIFVRKNEFACQDLLDRLAQKDIIAHVATTTEWLYYVDYLVKNGILESGFGFVDSLKFFLKQRFQTKFEKEIKDILCKSKLIHNEPIDIEKLINYGKNFVDIKLTGEPIIIIGAFFKEILNTVHGVISIGPFACLPTRVTEAILSIESTLENKIALSENPENLKIFEGFSKLPFLSIESDGNPFPSIIESRIEAFCLQVSRVHDISHKNSVFNQKNGALTYNRSD